MDDLLLIYKNVHGCCHATITAIGTQRQLLPSHEVQDEVRVVASDLPWLMNDLPQYSYCVVITHVLKVDVVHLIRPESTSFSTDKYEC